MYDASILVNLNIISSIISIVFASIKISINITIIIYIASCFRIELREREEK